MVLLGVVVVAGRCVATRPGKDLHVVAARQEQAP